MRLGFQPVFHFQSGYSGKFTNIRRDQYQVSSKGVSCNQQIIGPDGHALAGQVIAQFAIMPVRRGFQREDLEGG
jgi:hypothetical protein